MKWPTLKCPFCGGNLRNTDLRRGMPLVCPTCEAKLQYSKGQLWLSALIALCIDLAVLYLVGLRSLWLAVATILLWFPVCTVWEFVFVRIIPPRFEAYAPRGYKGGLFGN